MGTRKGAAGLGMTPVCLCVKCVCVFCLSALCVLNVCVCVYSGTDVVGAWARVRVLQGWALRLCVCVRVC